MVRQKSQIPLNKQVVNQISRQTYWNLQLCIPNPKQSLGQESDPTLPNPVVGCLPVLRPWSWGPCSLVLGRPWSDEHTPLLSSRCSRVIHGIPLEYSALLPIQVCELFVATIGFLFSRSLLIGGSFGRHHVTVMTSRHFRNPCEWMNKWLV